MNMPLVEKLQNHPQVVGLIEYGSAHYRDDFAVGDYDLFVVYDGLDTAVESLHFYIDGVPVDLNLCSLSYLRTQDVLSGFETNLLDGRIIYDKDGVVAALLEQMQKTSFVHYSDHDVAFTRHGHRHVLDKVRGRLESEPLLCKLLLSTNIYWLIQSYFGIRRLHYQGEKQALAYLAEHEPEIHNLISQFYLSELHEQVEITKQLIDLILAPIGGAWSDGEALAFGEDVGDLQMKG
ncbi:MAG: hypothetical protein AAGF95_30880 [Chloroflexota bacterium]